MNNRLLIFVFLSGLLSGCCSTRLVEMPPIGADQGFRPFLNPRTFDGPGFVFREVGRMCPESYPVTNLNVSVEQAGTEQFPIRKVTNEWTGSLIAKWIPDALVRASIKTEGTYVVQLELIGAERWRTYDNEIFQEIAREKPKWLGKGKYYVVRETISVTGIRMQVQRRSEGETSAGTAENSLEVAPQGSADLGKQRGYWASLERNFEHPHFVFYTREEIPENYGHAYTVTGRATAPVKDPNVGLIRQ